MGMGVGVCIHTSFFEVGVSMDVVQRETINSKIPGMHKLLLLQHIL